MTKTEEKAGKTRAILMKPADNVATALETIPAGSEVVLQADGRPMAIRVAQDIPFGHKFAIRDIAKGEHITKYGAPIGAATREIPAGHHTHVHNMVGLRGRGDLKD
jgi:altronate dehydratase small subunit